MPRKVFKFFLPVLYSPYFSSLVISIAVILLLPDFFEKYKSELTDSGILERRNALFAYEDLDHDGYSEEIEAFTNTEGVATIKVTNHRGIITNQWDFDGQMIPRGKQFFCGDYDNSGTVRIFMFTQRNDSLFLHCADPGHKAKFYFRNRFIVKILKGQKKEDYGVDDALLTDLDRDGSKEAVFTVMAGFPLKPRILFALDLMYDSLAASPECGVLKGINDIFDINGDRFPEIFCNTYAPSNYPDTSLIPCHDSSAWLIILDHKLRYVFRPEEFTGFTSSLVTIPFTSNDGKWIIAGYHHRGSPPRPSFMAVYDPNGKLLEKVVSRESDARHPFDILTLGSKREKLFKVNHNGVIQQLNAKLQIIRELEIRDLPCTRPSRVDIDRDGEPEFIFYNSSKNPCIITRNDFSDPVRLEIPVSNPIMVNLSLKLNGKNEAELFIQSNEHFFMCTYSRNPYYLLKYPFYAGIYLVILLLVFLIGLKQKAALKQKYNAEKKIASLQLLLLKDQMDPHFTFNAINSISASVSQNNPEEANRNIILFSKLVRACLVQSDRLSRTLQEEIDFVNGYMEIERNRLERKFEYHVQIAQDVDIRWMVPKMVIQIYAENALKHGIKPLKNGGIIKVNASRDSKCLVIEVEDNGIGRGMSQQASGESTGKGLGIMDQFYEIFNRYNEEKIRYEILDLSDEMKNARGTKVRIFIPIHLKYNFYE